MSLVVGIDTCSFISDCRYRSEFESRASLHVCSSCVRSSVFSRVWVLSMKLIKFLEALQRKEV